MALHMKPVDGIRSIAHLSLIALHTTMITSAHLPSEGKLWEAIKSHPIYTTFQAGAVQVDAMFMISAFLLVYSLLTANRLPSIPLYAFRRMMRMLPSMSLVILVGYLLGDCWELPFRLLDNSATIPARILVILLFVNNYFDQGKYGNFTGGLMWSCAADFQMSVLLFIIVTAIRSRTLSKSPSDNERVVLAQRLKYVFFFLLILSLVIRGLIFDKDTRNLVKLGQYSHMGLLMTDSSYEWLKVFYGHVWHTTNAAQALSQEFLGALYMPTHSRFGPFAVGGLLACNTFTTLHSITSTTSSSSTSTLSNGVNFILRWFFTLTSIVLLAIPCTPPPPIEDTPIEAQFITTVALRTLSSISVAYLLYRALLPSSHSSSWPSFASLLSFSPFHFISNISFCSYLIHFRVLMELIWNPKIRSLTGMTLPSVVISDDAPLTSLVNQWIQFLVLSYLLAVFTSFTLSTIFYYLFEKPVTRLIKSFVDDIVEGKDRKGHDNKKKKQ